MGIYAFIIRLDLFHLVVNDLRYTPKNDHLFKVFQNRMQQYCAAHIVHSCQQYCSALLSLNQPAIKCNNAMNNIVDNYEQCGQHNIVAWQTIKVICPTLLYFSK